MIGTVQLALFMFLVGFRFLCTYIFHFTMICLLRQSIASTKSPSIPPHAARDLDGCIYTCIERKRERERERALLYSFELKPCQTSPSLMIFDCLRIAWDMFPNSIPQPWPLAGTAAGR